MRTGEIAQNVKVLSLQHKDLSIVVGGEGYGGEELGMPVT